MQRIPGGVVVLGLLLASVAGCDDDDPEADAGSALDGGALRACMQADLDFSQQLSSDPQLRALRACTRDADCVAWTPRFECLGATILNCAMATRADQLDAAYARRDAIAAPICARLTEPCRVGVTCPPASQPRCQDGTCLIAHGASDGGT